MIVLTVFGRQPDCGGTSYRVSTRANNTMTMSTHREGQMKEVTASVKVEDEQIRWVELPFVLAPADPAKA